MPSRVPSFAEDSWTDHLPVCRCSGVGFSTNITYKHTGQPANEHIFEDGHLRIEHDSGLWLYGVFDGHNGKAVAEYAVQKMAAELLFGQLEHKDSDEEGTNISEASQKYPDIVKEIEAVTDEISAGASAVVALIKANKLYVATVGDCRALLCKTGPSGELRVIPLTVPHNIANADEVLRLSQLGLTPDNIRLFGHPTRCLGDFPRKGGYKDFENLSGATEEPVVADPELQGSMNYVT